MTSTEIETVEAQEVSLVNVETGEALAPTVDNAAVVLDAARRMKDRLAGVIEQATAFVVEETRRRGTKTLHLTEPTADGSTSIALSGGPSVEYDPETLAACLRDAGCPEDRIDAVVKAEVVYKVDRSVLRQLTSANEDYKAAAELAATEVVRPWRAYSKQPRR